MDFVSFAQDYNNGMSVKDMAEKYDMSVSVVRSRVHALRKKGVNLKSRKRTGIVSLTEAEVENINSML